MGVTRENGRGILLGYHGFIFVFQEAYMKKSGIMIAVAVVLVLALAGGMVALYWFTRPEPILGEKHITVTVVHGDESEKVFEYDTNEEYLGKVLSDAGLIQGDESTYGLMIHTVDGEKADWDANQSYWAVYLGEEYATTGIDQIVIKDGDVFSLVYTIG